MESDFPRTLKKCHSNKDLDEDVSFSNKLRKIIKVSPKNPFTSGKVLSFNNTQGNESDSRSEANSIASGKSFISLPDQSLCREPTCQVDPCFLIPQKYLKHLLGFPYRVEVRLKTSKLNSMSLLELTRQQVYLMLGEEAFYSISKAKKLSEDPAVRIWEVFVSLKYPKVMKEDRSGCCNKRKKVNYEMKYLEIYEKLKKLPNFIEKNLLMIEISINQLVRVGCFVEPWQFYARQVLVADRYFGYLAFGVNFLKTDCEKGIEVLRQLVSEYPRSPEAYLVLWHFFYGQKEYLEALNIIEKGYLQVKSHFFTSFSNLFLINLTKSLFKLKRFRMALEIHMKNYLNSKNNLFYLFLFGKSCIKSKSKKFRPAGLSALKEVLRWIKDFTRINYWYARGCYKSGKLLKARKHFQKVILSLNRNQVKHSIKVQNILGKIEMELKNLSFFKQAVQKNLGSYLQSHENLSNSQKIIIAEAFLAKENYSKALEVLENFQDFQSFSIICEKIIPNLPFITGKALLINKLDSMHKSSKVPLFEFIEACCSFCNFLCHFQLFEASLQILKRLLNFYPDFEKDLPYVQQEKTFWESMNLLRFTSNSILNPLKKKELVMKSILSTLSLDQSLDSDSDPLKSAHLSKKKSSSMRPVGEAPSTSSTISTQCNLITSLKSFGVYTDGELLLQIASTLDFIPGTETEQFSCLESFLKIMRKPVNNLKICSKLKTLAN